MHMAYRVLDISDEKGQYCGKILADLGCDVIKIERPGGDPVRWAGPFYQDTPDPNRSLTWFAYNRGKKSVTLNIESSDGQAVLKDLVKQAHVVIESSAPGYLDGLGLGYASLNKINPAIVMASITPFGQDGPYGKYKGPDIVVSALSGFMGLNGDPDRAPLNTSAPHAYMLASVHAAQGILLALYHQEKTGRGQYVDVCAQQSMAWNVIDVDYWPEYGKIEGKREGNNYKAANGIIRSFISLCKDGYVCFFLYGGAHGAHSNRELQQWMESEGMFEPILQGLKWEELDLLTEKAERVTEICEAFDRFFKTRTRAELQERAVARKILMAPCCTISDLLESPQLKSRAFWAHVEHPELGETLIYPGACAASSAFPRNGFLRAPMLGEHNDIIRAAAASEWGRGDGSTGVGSSGNPVGIGQALRGLKVLDFTQAQAGPMAARLLAEQGATVIHVESEAKMDIYRVTPPYKAQKPGINRSTLFANVQAGKYGIALNMDHPRAAEVTKRLVAWADVIVDSRTPGVLEKWGLGYADLIKVKPDIILARLTNQGIDGLWAKHPGYGTQIIGQAGMIGIVGWPDREPLMFGRATYADLVASSLFIAYLIAALVHRQVTGQGQHLDASMVEGCINFLAPQVLDYVANGRELQRTGNRRDGAAPHGAFPCKGTDSWCAIAVTTDAEWGQLCMVMGKPDLAADPRFATLTARKENEDELERIVGAWTSELPAVQVMTLLQEAGVAAGVVNDFREVWEDPQLRHRQHFRSVPHTEMGSHTVSSYPYILSRTPCVTPRGAPCMGEHNEYVYCKLLGLSDEEFLEMHNEGVFK